ncbi:MAG: hypothetical protein RIS76_699 [Verrucomicrobiota bacterium]
MKQPVTRGSILLATILGLMPLPRMTAQSLTVLHRFSARPEGTNQDGADPAGQLVTDPVGKRLYGTANQGGAYGVGTVFSLGIDGSDFVALHSFEFSTGFMPFGGVVLSDNILFGTTSQGGASGNGSVFALHLDGSGFETLHTFPPTVGNPPFATNRDGAQSSSGLVAAGNRLYGTAVFGGSGGNGTVFALNTDGTGFTVLHSFRAGGQAFFGGNYTNIGGIRPNGGLVLSGNTLYGTAGGGGNFARGTVFRVNTDGTGFATLHNFRSTPFDPVNDPGGLNNEGASPKGGLALSGDTLFGTTLSGGIGGESGLGTVFALRTDGTQFRTLHRFTSSSGAYRPQTELVVSGDTLYGTTEGAGGTLFSLRTDGTGFLRLHTLRLDVDGNGPGSPVLLGTQLYAVAASGGPVDEGSPGGSGTGTVFRLSFAPPLTIQLSGTGSVLSWPTHFGEFDYSGYTLEGNPDPGVPTAWSTVLSTPSIANGRYTVPIPFGDDRRFFRLKSP